MEIREDLQPAWRARSTNDRSNATSFAKPSWVVQCLALRESVPSAPPQTSHTALVPHAPAGQGIHPYGSLSAPGLDS